MGVSLDLGIAGVIGLAVLLVVAAAGWTLYLASRRSAAQPLVPAPSAPAAAPLDPIDAAFRAAETGLADAVLLCRRGVIARAGAAPSRLLGPDPSRLIGLGLTRLAATEEILPLAEALRRLEREGLSTLDVTFRTSGVGGGPPGRTASARLLRPPGGAPGTFIVVLGDISATAVVARDAAAIAARIQEALSALRDAVLVTARAGDREIVVLANPGAEDLFGVRPIAGRPLADLRQKMAATFPADAVDRLLGENPPEASVLVEAGGEARRVIERTTVPLRAGAESGRLLSFREVTQESAREETLRRAADEAHGAREALERWHEQIMLANEGLERRMTEMARFNREMKSLDEMKSNLLANVSHELQTPLVSIRGYTEMILKGKLGPLTEEQEKGLRVALRNADRLIGLIDGLLAFARAEKDKPPLRLEAFPLRPLVEEIVDLLKDRAAERRVSLSVEFPGGEIIVRGDRDRIAQVFINLLTNAIKYNVEGGSVVVEAMRGSRSTARVDVRDTGVGIAREDLERIFDRFYRAGAAEGEGSGLGLAITKDILRQHGCLIRGDSEPGRGSTFSFTLPLDSKGRGEKARPAGGGEHAEP